MTASRFVVQLHDATRLHFDVRIQVGQVLRSWAVPKGPSLDPAQRRLAVPSGDHPLEAGDFEGVHEGQARGSGAVIIWDEGPGIPILPNGGQLARGLRRVRPERLGGRLHEDCGGRGLSRASRAPALGNAVRAARHADRTSDIPGRLGRQPRGHPPDATDTTIRTATCSWSSRAACAACWVHTGSMRLGLLGRRVWRRWRRVTVLRARSQAGRLTTWLILGLIGVAGALLYAWALWKIPDRMDLHNAQDRYNARILVISVGGAVVVMIGLLYTARSYRLSHRGQITDRFTKALEQLNADQLYVRVGGIRALGPADPGFADPPRRCHRGPHILRPWPRTVGGVR